MYRQSPAAPKEGEGKLLARYAVTLDERGCLSNYRRLEDGETAHIYKRAEEWR